MLDLLSRGGVVVGGDIAGGGDEVSDGIQCLQNQSQDQQNESRAVVPVLDERKKGSILNRLEATSGEGNNGDHSREDGEDRGDKTNHLVGESVSSARDALNISE